MSESEEPVLISWDDMEVSPYRHSKRNWMEGINRANIGAIETYKEIESTETASKKYPGLSVRYRGKVV